ncbi:hypothetical protein GCM10020221_28270 [Streptomyces thioluteus]|uniref:Pyridoxal phosphate-dependent aminotransferase n=1 Tax=Streptomyces thioluteus TaxID=66431 RepID=A0ABN3X0D1_STRTU
MTAPLPAVRTGRPAAVPAAGRWYGPRVPLPPLSIEALRIEALRIAAQRSPGRA